MSTTPISYYAIVTFGTPGRRLPKVTRSLDRAKRYAQSAKGSGTCSAARVYQCDSQGIARSADISEVRDGEKIVFHA